MSIRFKVILPYLLLTLLIAVTGAYVVTRLVANSLEERLANQLLEAGRVVSDSMARQELDQVQSARIIAFTRGMSEALNNGDKEQVILLAKPAAGGLNIENLIVYDQQGHETFHMIKQSNETFLDATQQDIQSTFFGVNELIAEDDPNSLPKRELAKDPANDQYYYFTSIPITHFSAEQTAG